MQLALSVAWSGLFFGLRRPDWAAVEIGMLWLVIAATAAAFFRLSRVAGALMVPYPTWVTSAAGLDGAIWWLNR